MPSKQILIRPIFGVHFRIGGCARWKGRTHQSQRSQIIHILSGNISPAGHVMQPGIFHLIHLGISIGGNRRTLPLYSLDQNIYRSGRVRSPQKGRLCSHYFKCFVGKDRLERQINTPDDRNRNRTVDITLQIPRYSIVFRLHNRLPMAAFDSSLR